MPYRDDRAALEATREDLKRALEEAPQLLAELAVATRRRAAVADELARVEARLARIEAGRPPRVRRWLASAAAAIGVGLLVPAAPLLHKVWRHIDAPRRCAGVEEPIPARSDPTLIYEWSVNACFNSDAVRLYTDHRAEILDGYNTTVRWSGVHATPAVDRFLALAGKLRAVSMYGDCGTAQRHWTLYGSGWRPASREQIAEVERLGYEVRNELFRVCDAASREDRPATVGAAPTGI